MQSTNCTFLFFCARNANASHEKISRNLWAASLFWHRDLCLASNYCYRLIEFPYWFIICVLFVQWESRIILSLGRGVVKKPVVSIVFCGGWCVLCCCGYCCCCCSSEIISLLEIKKIAYLNSKRKQKPRKTFWQHNETFSFWYLSGIALSAGHRELVRVCACVCAHNKMVGVVFLIVVPTAHFEYELLSSKFISS